MEGQLSKEDYMELLKQEIDVASTQELISVKYDFLILHTTFVACCDIMLIFSLQKITEKCFKKCIGKPGTSLGSSDQVLKKKCELNQQIIPAWN